MKANTSEPSRLVDQAAKTVHETIERVHKRAAKMEDGFSSRAKGPGERIVARFQSKMNTLESYIEANPVMSALVAFGVGIGTSRLFKAMELMPPGMGPAVEGTPGGKTPKPGSGETA